MISVLGSIQNTENITLFASRSYLSIYLDIVMNQRFLNTEGIILKRINYKDADKILTIYTKDAGKISAIAKGIRKINSKRKSHLELLNHVKMHLIKSGDMYIVAQTEVISTNPNIRGNLEKTNLAYYITEIFEKIIVDEDQNDILFKFLQKTLKILNESSDITFVNGFNLKLLKLTGFYSKNKIEHFPNEIKEHFKQLEIMKYEDILNIKPDYMLAKTAHEILKSLTEEILEKSLKVKLFI